VQAASKGATASSRSRVRLVLLLLVVAGALIRAVLAFFGPESAGSLANHAAKSIAVGNYDQAIQYADAALAKEPANLDALVNRGVAYIGKQRYDDALADLGRALAIDPANATALGDSCIAEFATKKYDRAIRFCNLAVQNKPNYPHALLVRGASYLAEHDFERARNDFDSVIGLDPLDFKAYLGRAQTFLATDQFGPALNDLNTASHLGPDAADAILYERGLIHYYTGAYQLARDDLGQALAKDPKDAYKVIWRHLANLRSGQDDQNELAANALKIAGGKWPAPVVDLYINHGTIEDVFAEAAMGSESTQRDQACEAQFYVGEYYLQNKLIADAKRSFKSAIADCPPDFVEFTAAKAEMKLLGS